MPGSDMFNILRYNSISAEGVDLLPASEYVLSAESASPDAILVRSERLHEMELPVTLKAIARAGAGVNNIPVDACTDRGIAVFNTPGANANAVKELVLMALLLSSRRIYQGIRWTQSLAGRGDDVGPAVEKGKVQFEGPELKGKRLGVIGLGAIGVMVANDGIALGMEVMGYDKYLSVDSAWGLSRHVVKAASLEQLLSRCDYITVHVPLSDETAGMISAREFGRMKPGVRIVNLARGDLVKNADLLSAIAREQVGCYVTDFPSDDLLGNDRIITIPHLGASTPESAENCVTMAVRQLRSFLEDGTVINSVNFPDCNFGAMQDIRFVIAH